MKLQKFPILAAALLGAWWGASTDLWAHGGGGHGGGGHGGGGGGARGGFPAGVASRGGFGRVGGFSQFGSTGGVSRFNQFGSTGGVSRFNQFGSTGQYYRFNRFANTGAINGIGVNRFDGYNRFNRFDRFNRFNRFNRFGGFSIAGAGYPYPYAYPWFFPYNDPYAYGAGAPGMAYNPVLPAVAEGPDVGAVPPAVAGANCTAPVAGDVIGNVQRALKYQGFYRGPIDGLSGPILRSSVRSYQASVGLPANGAIDARLLNSLGIVQCF